MNKSLFLILVFFTFQTINAQHKNFGWNIGYENSRNLIRESEVPAFSNSRVFHSFYTGIFYELSPSQTQASRKARLLPFINFELGGCWCGGYFNVDVIKNQKPYLDEYEYLVYRAEMAVIGGWSYNGLKLLLGAEFVHPFYNARKSADRSTYTENSAEYENASLGVNLGLGYDYKFLRFDIRYQKLITDYGLSYRGSKFEFTERQWRFTTGILLFQKNIEKNYNGILWE